MRSWTGGFEVLASVMGAGVFVVAETDGMRWMGCWASSRLEVLAHLADAEGCEVGEDLSAGGGGFVEQGQE
ncbi:hypothetical protein [Rhodococcus koreensis]|uniref:hypothetical protein n=1 Tax=Rhodococcus koreensis TaxID=99653 RepID=UPI0036714B27